MTYNEQARFDRTEEITQFFDDCVAGLAQIISNTLRPAIRLARTLRNREAAARISRRLITP